jgi:hypothetical protein
MFGVFQLILYALDLPPGDEPLAMAARLKGENHLTAMTSASASCIACGPVQTARNTRVDTVVEERAAMASWSPIPI